MQSTRKQYNKAMERVDKLLLDACGVTHLDLEDFMSYDFVADECSPIEIALECLYAQELQPPREVYEELERVARNYKWSEYSPAWKEA